MTARLTPAAHADIRTITQYSRKQHGLEAAVRYGYLLQTAIEALGSDPMLIGSEFVNGVDMVRSYPIRLRRYDAPPGLRVLKPRHVIPYRVLDGDVAEILAIVHDRMLLDQAASRALDALDKD